jgi:hypothetical protein
MQKLRLSNRELVFIIIASVTLFAVTFHQMSTSGVLPGNDPSVHLGKTARIVLDEGVSYSEVAWYPPLFHTIVAMLQIFAGTLDVMVAAFLTKLLIATLNVLILLATYLLSRKFFGQGVAVASTVFTVLSIPLSEMIFWGGYANFLGLAYIALIFYIMNKDFKTSTKILLLFLGAATIGLTHTLVTFVFVLMFVPAFLVSTIGARKKILIFLAVIVGGGLALLAWYARILLEYADMIIDHIFFSMEENVYHITAVSLDGLLKNFGVTLVLASAGIPLTFILIKKKKVTKSSLLIIFWLAVPFFLAQLYYFEVFLPYHRFVYFFATPIAILSGLTTYYVIKTSRALIESKVIPRIAKPSTKMAVSKIFTIAIVFSLFFIQAFSFTQVTAEYPIFYERAPISSYEAGIWVKEHSVPDGIVITTRSPGSWFYVFSDHNTTQETDPLYSRSPVAESLLYSFYEMENSLTLTREFHPVSQSAGQAIYASVFNIWTKTLTIPNKQVIIHYYHLGEEVEVRLSETTETIYWKQNSTDKMQLVTEYAHDLFTVQKIVTMSSSNKAIDIEWSVQAHEEMANVTLSVDNYFEISLDFDEAFLPGVLEWQNPWDNATFIHPVQNWTLVEGAELLYEKLVAVLDTENGLLAAFQFDEQPDGFSIGALKNRFIDAVRIRYAFGDLTENEKHQVSFSTLVHAFEFEEITQWTTPELKQQFSSQPDKKPIEGRDFNTYIDEYNIKFVVVDTQKFVSTIEATPALDKIYYNGRIAVYTTKR